MDLTYGNLILLDLTNVVKLEIYNNDIRKLLELPYNAHVYLLGPQINIREQINIRDQLYVRNYCFFMERISFKKSHCFYLHENGFSEFKYFYWL